MKSPHSLTPVRPFPRIALATILFVSAALLALGGWHGDQGGGGFGGTDINLIAGGDSVTQNDSVVWGHGNTVVVVYNDARAGSENRAGVSVSTDGGATFIRLAQGQFSGLGVRVYNPSVFYSVRAGKWFASFIASGCGAQGLGQWESTHGLTWSSSGCVSSADLLDLHSTWVDNNPGSPFYGRQYATFSNFNIGSGVPQLTFSTDDGVTWSTPVTLSGATFRRALKVTGSLGTDGTIFVQTMEEGGGGLNGPRMNHIYRSTNGGVSFTAIQQNAATFLTPGRSAESSPGYFVGMYSTPVAGYWTDMGWGQPGVGPNGVVHYVYGARTASPADPGNIYYIRSIDNGSTWSAPLKLNTDTTTRAQWGASLSVNAAGRIFVSWYDERNTTNDSLERFGRESFDNGASWEPDGALSDVVFPKPLQGSPLFRSTSVGTLNYAAFSDDGFGPIAYHTWTDGRVNTQQDVFFDKVNVVPNAPLVVTTIADHFDGSCDAADCTLREAINAANTAPGSDTIVFAPGVTGIIQLIGALPLLNTNLTLQCPGANLLTVRRDTGGNYRIFTVSNLTPVGPVVSISGLTVANGEASSAFPGNIGGGILNDHGDLTIKRVTFSGNVSTTFGGGGGLYNYGATSDNAQLVVSDSTFSNNNGGFYGGGIYNDGASGGGANLIVTNTTFYFNAAGGSGGGIFNTASSGGVANATVTNCTFADNFGGIADNSGGPFAVIVRNSIFKSSFGQSLSANPGAIVSQGHNLSSDAAGGDGGTGPGGLLNGPGDKRNTNPQLDSAGPANNGGPTMTVALLSGSPAINMGDDALAPTLDQRGYARSGVSDMGAFEFNGVAPPPPTPTGAVSRKLHNGTPFDIPLPLTGLSGVECRSGGATNDHQIIVNFASAVTFTGASITAGAGSVASSTGTGTTILTVNLTGVTSGQTTTVSLVNVNDGVNVGNVSVPLGVLIGDTNGNGTVNVSDVAQAKSQSGQALSVSNFRMDVNASGAINVSDIAQVKAQSGTTLP